MPTPPSTPAPPKTATRVQGLPQRRTVSASSTSSHLPNSQSGSIPPSPLSISPRTPADALAPTAGTPRPASTPISATTSSTLVGIPQDRVAGGGTGPVAGAAQGTPSAMSRPRARDLLRKHYGLGVGPPQPLSGPSKPLDPMDIDSPAFDAKSYYEQLITTSSLSTLLRKENELLSDIRQLESERQSLVYNHHHELIAASDTIAAMKKCAESIDADLDKLMVAFSEISRITDELSATNSIQDGTESTLT